MRANRPRKKDFGRTLVLGLGNTLLCDDGVGIYVVRRLKKDFVGEEKLHFEESSEAGLALLDLLIGYEHVFILDALPVTDGPFGSVTHIPPAQWDDVPLASSPHYTGLPSLLKMGQRLGYTMPSRVRLFGITVKDPFSVKEGLSPEIERALPGIVSHIKSLLLNHLTGLKSA